MELCVCPSRLFVALMFQNLSTQLIHQSIRYLFQGWVLPSLIKVIRIYLLSIFINVYDFFRQIRKAKQNHHDDTIENKQKVESTRVPQAGQYLWLVNIPDLCVLPLWKWVRIQQKNGFGEMDLGLSLINSHYVTKKIGPKSYYKSPDCYAVVFTFVLTSFRLYL